MKPTSKEFWNAHCDDHEDIKSIMKKLDDSWRHGNRVYEIFHRESDDTYWGVNYNESGDGEYNGLNEDECDIEQVKKVVKTVEVIEWKAMDNENFN